MTPEEKDQSHGHNVGEVTRKSEPGRTGGAAARSEGLVKGASAESAVKSSLVGMHL